LSPGWLNEIGKAVTVTETKLLAWSLILNSAAVSIILVEPLLLNEAGRLEFPLKFLEAAIVVSTFISPIFENSIELTIVADVLATDNWAKL
jgi:hypothetical protein